MSDSSSSADSAGSPDGRALKTPFVTWRRIIFTMVAHRAKVEEIVVGYE
jgi:hypothetical protein